MGQTPITKWLQAKFTSSWEDDNWHSWQIYTEHVRNTARTSDPPKIRRECTNGHLSLLRADLAFFFFFFFPRAELQMKGTNALGSQQSTTKHKSVPTALAWRKENHLGKSDMLLWNHWFSCCTVIQLDKKGKISTAEVFVLGSDTGDNAKFSSHSRTNRNCELSTTLMNIHSKGGV